MDGDVIEEGKEQRKCRFCRLLKVFEFQFGDRNVQKYLYMQIGTSLKVHSAIKMVRSLSMQQKNYALLRRRLRIRSWGSLKEPTENRFRLTEEKDNLMVYGFRETGVRGALGR